MGSIDIKPEKKTVNIKDKVLELELYSKGKLKKFNPTVLGIGDISQPSTQIDAIAAIFDLSKFTNFCKQVDPHLSIPKYLSEFLNWLFVQIKEESLEKKFKKGHLMYIELPFFAKFLGDGVLFLWATKNMDMVKMCNVLVTLRNICNRYGKEFLPKASKEWTDIPTKLRCGVARGMVCSVGNGGDYIGPCINIASRLQKLSSLPFCFSRRGFDFEKGMAKETSARYVVKSVAIRGVGDRELVCVRKPEFEKLPKREKANFKDV